MPTHNFFDKAGPFSISEIASSIGAELRHENPNLMVSDVASLTSAKEGDITFLMSPKYKKHLEGTKASACIIDPTSAADAPKGLALLIHPNPHEAFAAVCLMICPDPRAQGFKSDKASIAPSAVISDTAHISDFVVVEEGAKIGEGVHIGANTYIGRNVVIGNNTTVYPGATISHAQIGSYCVIHSGARIGQDGFGFAQTQRGLLKVKQLGSVVIGHHVEVGANTCIDRGAIEDTIIGDGTKIDNLVQIGHNTVIGKSCVICGQVGLAGSSIVQDFVMLGGQVGVAGHLTIGSGSMIAAQGGVMSDIPPKSIMGGAPAMPIRDWHKGNAIMRKLINSNRNNTSDDKSSK